MNMPQRRMIMMSLSVFACATAATMVNPASFLQPQAFPSALSQWFGWQQAAQQAPQQMQAFTQTTAKAQMALPYPQYERALEVEPSYVAGYEVVKKFPHDQGAFTQGLFVHDGVMFESTGLYGKSSVRKVDVNTGKVLQMSKFSDNIFGEGITLHKGKIFALTWHERTGYRIDPDTLRVEEQFELPSAVKEGWGITSDGTDLLVTDSTSKLFRMDDKFQVKSTKTVYDPLQKVELPFLNELEFIDGKIYANVYGLDHIAVVDPEKAQVERWIDCRGLWPGGPRGTNTVFNGIAYDQVGKHLYVTGKNWPALYEIKLRE